MPVQQYIWNSEVIDCMLQMQLYAMVLASKNVCKRVVLAASLEDKLPSVWLHHRDPQRKHTEAAGRS